MTKKRARRRGGLRLADHIASELVASTARTMPAPPLVSPPQDFGMAEAGLINSIGLRAGQLLALADMHPGDLGALEVLNRATDEARAHAAAGAPIRPALEHVVAIGAALGARIRVSLVRYAREYDAAGDDERVLESARAFRIALARALVDDFGPKGGST
ncbi:MAG: hypothetical protein ACHP7H_00690 [Hyphomicrobiales bacterium]